jgi:UDPglucose 6-dehydrogenase
LWGLAFKANTDDMREAPSLALIEALAGAGATVAPTTRWRMDNARASVAGNGAVQFAPSAREACEGADALAVVTEWLEFRSPDFDWLAGHAEVARGVRRPQPLRPAQVRAAGLHVLRHRAGRGRSGRSEHGC